MWGGERDCGGGERERLRVREREREREKKNDCFEITILHTAHVVNYDFILRLALFKQVMAYSKETKSNPKRPQATSMVGSLFLFFLLFFKFFFFVSKTRFIKDFPSGLFFSLLPFYLSSLLA